MFVHGYKVPDSALCPFCLHHQVWAVGVLAYLFVSGL